MTNIAAIILQYCCNAPYDLSFEMTADMLIFDCMLGGAGASAASYVAQPLPAGTELSDAHGFNEAVGSELS